MPTGAHVHVDGYIGRVWRQVRPRYEFLFLHEISMLGLDERAETESILRVMSRVNLLHWAEHRVGGLGTKRPKPCGRMSLDFGIGVASFSLCLFSL